MTDPGDGTTAGMVARFLWQKVERGEGPLIMEFLTRKDVGSAVRKARELPSRTSTGSQAKTEAPRAAEDRPAPAPATPAVEDSPAPAPATRDRAQTPAARPTGRSSPGAPPLADDAAVPPLPPELEGVRQIALGCTRCRLSETRTQVVFADGVARPRVLVLGEAPGQNEDNTGLPFVGAAGKLLDLLLASVGVSRRENAYICNVIKCRPPGNRNPLPDEISSCTPFLQRQVELAAPEVILAVGTFAAQWVTGQENPLGKLRGSVYSYEGIPAVVTYHPAALLRNSGWTRATWDDLQLLRSILDGA